MKRSKVIGIGLVLAIIASVVFAAEDAIQLRVQELYVGKSAVQVSGSSSQLLEGLVAGTYPLPGVVGKVVTVTAANSQVLTNSGTVMSITMLGATCTVANVTTSGQICYLTVTKPASTGVLAVASSGNFIGPALSLAPGEMATLVAVGTNWFSVGQ